VWALPGFLIVWAYHITIGFVSLTGAGYIHGKISYIGFNLYSIFRCVFEHNMFMKDGLAKDVIAARVI
jgi:hypothetical protein